MFDRRALIDAIILVGVIIVASPAYTQEKSIVVASVPLIAGALAFYIGQTMWLWWDWRKLRKPR